MGKIARVGTFVSGEFGTLMDSELDRVHDLIDATMDDDNMNRSSQHSEQTFFDYNKLKIITIGDGTNSIGNINGATETPFERAFNLLDPSNFAISGKIVVLPGTYTFYKNLTVPRGCIVEGINRAECIIKKDTAFDYILTIPDSAMVQHVTFDLSTTQNPRLVELTGEGSIVQHCIFQVNSLVTSIHKTAMVAIQNTARFAEIRYNLVDWVAAVGGSSAEGETNAETTVNGPRFCVFGVDSKTVKGSAIYCNYGTIKLEDGTVITSGVNDDAPIDNRIIGNCIHRNNTGTAEKPRNMVWIRKGRRGLLASNNFYNAAAHSDTTQEDSSYIYLQDRDWLVVNNFSAGEASNGADYGVGIDAAVTTLTVFCTGNMSVNADTAGANAGGTAQEVISSITADNKNA